MQFAGIIKGNTPLPKWYAVFNLLIVSVLFNTLRHIGNYPIINGIGTSNKSLSAIALLFLLTPNSFSQMLPAKIRKAAPKWTKRGILVLASVLYPLYIGLIAYAILSAYLAGASGFWNLFWMGYIEMFFVNLGDFFGLDWWFRAKFKDRIMLPGPEDCNQLKGKHGR